MEREEKVSSKSVIPVSAFLGGPRKSGLFLQSLRLQLVEALQGELTSLWPTIEKSLYRGRSCQITVILELTSSPISKKSAD